MQVQGTTTHPHATTLRRPPHLGRVARGASLPAAARSSAAIV